MKNRTATSPKEALSWLNTILGVVGGVITVGGAVLAVFGASPVVWIGFGVAGLALLAWWFVAVRGHEAPVVWHFRDDGTITRRRDLDPADHPPPTLWRPPAAEPTVDSGSILTLLEWRSRLVPLEAREEELAELAAWVTAEPPDGATRRDVRLCLLSGPGGVGKSRLAGELCERLRARDWTAAFLKLDVGGPTYLPAGAAGTLVVIDYPEESRERLRRLLRSLGKLETHSHPLRVLLLSRHGEELWHDDVGDADGITLDAARVLEPLPHPDGLRLFEAARRRLAEGAAGPLPDPPSDEDFLEWQGRNPLHRRPLLVLAAAVVSLQRPAAWKVDLSARELIAALVERELKRLRDESRDRGWPRQTLPRVLAMATLAGGLPVPRLRELAARGDELGWTDRPANPIRFVDRLRATGRLERGDEEDDDAPERLPPLTPDLVAAHLTWTVLRRDADLAPERLWTAIEGDVPDGLERLSRMIYDAEVTLELPAPGMSEWLREALEEEEERDERCAAALAYFYDARLPQSLARCAEVVWRTALEGETDSSKKAEFLNNLSVDLAATGGTAAALDAIQQAVDIRRRLARDNPQRFEPDLAGSLNNLSNRLAAAGDTAAALDAIQQAVDIYRRLARDNPQRFEPDLASSLNNLSNRLAAAGDTAAALDAIQQAVDIYRRLARDNPQRFEPDLASSLNNLSVHLAAAGDTAAALDAIQQAVDIRRRLARDNPQRFEPDLASSLNNLSNRLAAAGDTAAALDAIQQAVDIRRRLARDNPQRFEPDLAGSLNNLSVDLAAAGDTAAALDAIQQAVDVHRRLARDNPQRFEPDLAGSLAVLSLRLRETDDAGAALPAIEEAIRLIQPYAERYPESTYGRWYRSMLGDRQRLIDDGAGGGGGAGPGGEL